MFFLFSSLQLIQTVYPDLYRVDDLCDDDEQAIIEESEDSELKVCFETTFFCLIFPSLHDNVFLGPSGST